MQSVSHWRTCSWQHVYISKEIFTLTGLIFGIEVLIVLFLHDSFIRARVGDILVVILISCFIRTFQLSS